MQRKFTKTISRAAACAACLLITNLTADVKRPPASASQGMLMSINPKGEPAGPCPLKHTSVKADISGFLSRVTVTQEFENPYQEKIEALYTFPLPQNAAVDSMTMQIGDRTVAGKIKRFGRFTGKRRNWKKAYVCLKPGQEINFAAET